MKTSLSAKRDGWHDGELWLDGVVAYELVRRAAARGWIKFPEPKKKAALDGSPVGGGKGNDDGNPTD